MLFLQAVSKALAGLSKPSVRDQAQKFLVSHSFIATTMFRPTFKSALRFGVFSRGFATARPASRFTATKAVVGATLLLSTLTVFPLSSITNDVDQKKVEKEKKDVIVAAGEEKAAEKVDGRDEQPSEGSDAHTESEEGGQSAAFNPETGEINWDCPCLGGMADGPCGEEFKEAFSCFVYSETEPKGIDCIGKFEAMRTCFKQHPEHYKEELYEDDEPVPSVEDESVSKDVAEAAVAEKTEPDVVEIDKIETPSGDSIEKVIEQPATVA